MTRGGANNMGRLPKEHTMAISIRIPLVVHRRLKDISEQTNKSMSAIVSDILQDKYLIDGEERYISRHTIINMPLPKPEVIKYE